MKPACSLVPAAMLAMFVMGSSAAAGTDGAATAARQPPPAGQMCPEGSFVIGFDAESNIVCSGPVEAAVGSAPVPAPAAPEPACPDPCPAAGSGGVAAGAASVAAPAPRQPAPPAGGRMPVIADIEPSSVVYGAREITVAILGEGFQADTVVLFRGSRYTPSVNEAGTELRVTLPTRGLTIGPHAITVSNGPDLQATARKGLEVF